MTVSAANVATAVTLSAVSIIYDTSGTEVELAAANYSYSNGVITLNLTSGSGRVTLENLTDTVEISTEWSNGDVAVADSQVLEVVPPITITAPESFNYNAESVTITASNVATAVTLSAVSIIYDTSGTEVELAAANYTYSNGVITLNLTSGSGRVTLNNVSDGVTISTTWSNGDVATDTSNVLEVLPISITAPESFIYNQNGIEVTAANVPAGVTLSGVSLVNGGTTTALNVDNYTISGNTITLNFGYEYNKNRVLLANAAANITISTTWSNGDTATDTTTINTGMTLDSSASSTTLTFLDAEELNTELYVIRSTFPANVTASSVKVNDAVGIINSFSVDENEVYMDLSVMAVNLPGISVGDTVYMSVIFSNDTVLYTQLIVR